MALPRLVPYPEGACSQALQQERLAAKALLLAPQGATLLIEAFDWQGYRESLPVLERLLSPV